MSNDTKLCMFCGKDESFGEMTMEHFVMKALWDGARPTHTRTVPAHKSCNQSFSEDNEWFRDILVFEKGADSHPEVRKLRAGKIARKIENKFGSISKIVSRARVLPVTTPSGIYVGDAPAIPVDVERRDRVLYNVMKGVFYTVQEVPLPNEWQWGIKRLEELETDVVEFIEGQMGLAWHTFGDDVFMCKYVFDLEHGGGISCLMSFYKHRIFWGWATSIEFIESERNRIQESLIIKPPMVDLAP